MLRVVPDVERGERLNAGVVLFARTRDFLGARVRLDESRLEALWPGADAPAIARHLDGLARVAAGDPAAGPIAALPPSQRFHWLVAPASTVDRDRPCTPASATTRPPPSTACSSGSWGRVAAMPGAAFWSGWILFAGIMMLLIGAFNVLQGLAAIFSDDYYVAKEEAPALRPGVGMDRWDLGHRAAGSPAGAW